MTTDFALNTTNFVQTFGEELQAKRRRLEYLIENSHNPSIGSYYESLVREQLRRILPDSLKISTGFVLRSINDGGTKYRLLSSQIDILIWDNHRHTSIFEDGDFVMIPPEACVGAIEVTKSLDGDKIRTDLAKIDSVLKFSHFQGASSHKYFTAVVGFEGVANASTLLSNTQRYYCDNSHYYRLRDEEPTSWKTSVGMSRRNFVDVVLCLDHCCLRTASFNNNRIHVAFAHDSNDFALNFGWFDSFLFRSLTTRNQPETAHLSSAGRCSMDINFDGLELACWSVLENCQQPLTQDQIEALPFVIDRNREFYTERYMAHTV